MNYEREMGKMKKHREKYFPVMARYLGLFRESGPEPVTVEIADAGEIALVLELIDIGYLDGDAFIVKKNFGTVTRLAYNGRYPLTREGDFCLKDSGFCERSHGLAGLLGKLLGKKR